MLEAARQRAAQLRARIASPAQASTSARTTPETASIASTAGQPQVSGVLRDYLATRAAAISDSALPQSPSAIARPGQGQTPGIAQQAPGSAEQAATGTPPQHSGVLRDYLATQRALAARPLLQGPAASRAQQSRAPDAQAARQEVEQSRGLDAAQGRPQFTGVLGSYMATQAAARSGIGRYGPGNPPLSQASGGWLNLSKSALRELILNHSAFKEHVTDAVVQDALQTLPCWSFLSLAARTLASFCLSGRQTSVCLQIEGLQMGATAPR